MEKIVKKLINWEKTGRNLKFLRQGNMDLRRYVCRVLKYDDNDCDGACESCNYKVDDSISQRELAEVFNVTDNVICNWESGKTVVGLEDLLYYCRIAKVDLFDLLVLE